MTPLRTSGHSCSRQPSATSWARSTPRPVSLPGRGASPSTARGGFSASLGEQKLEGKYTYDAETHVVSLSSDHEKLKQYGAVAGRAYIDGSALQLLIPATKLLEIVQSVSAQSESLAGVSTLLANYQNLYIGFSFTRKE